MSTVSASTSTGRAPVKFGIASTVDEKIRLITRNLDEEKRDLRVYWGTATTGQPHIAYFVPMSKLADFLRAGCEVTILFADLHAYLDNMKSSWEVLIHRTKYYEAVIKGMLESIGVPLDKLKFVTGTEYQLSREYTLDVYKLSSMTTERNAKKAGAEVVKQVESPLLSGLLYPLLQALDEEYLKVDAQFGGVDQRKIFTLAEEVLPKIGYAKRIHLMNPMVPGLTGLKMSSSEKASKIGLLDTDVSIQDKVRNAFCEEGSLENNGVLAFVKMVLFQVFEGEPFVIERAEKHGGNVKYESYQQLEADFVAKKIFPLDLKHAVNQCLSRLLNPIRKKFEAADLEQLVFNAYPEEKAQADAAKAEAEAKEERKTMTPAEKKAALKAAAAAKAAAANVVDITKLDIRVGKITKIGKHPEADTLYVEEIDLGESAPRQVVSGLVKYYSTEQLTDRKVVVLCNIKPSKQRGVESHAMVLAAASADGTAVELLDPHADSKAGDRITAPGYDVHPEVARANEKVIGQLLNELCTSEDLNATYKGGVLGTSAGPVTVPSLKNAKIK